MKQIIVTEKRENESNLFYVQSALGEVFTHAGCSIKNYSDDKRSALTVNCPKDYADIVTFEMGDKIAEVIAIKYKNDFFKKTVKVSGLPKVEREILTASLIAADLDDDKKYAFERLKGQTSVAIDGVYNFRLGLLKKKWAEITEYVPTSFLKSQLKEFIGYLIENKRKRIYVDSGRVYDSHYRRLKRSSLLDGNEAKITREILLSNCGEIRLTGRLPEQDEYYLKEFYNDKIIFSSGY
ncbi:MAG: hypothetical protein IJV99_03495 [Clostridia bacterium]|nr:hypothetical protein [Clostridia bacterium]